MVCGTEKAPGECDADSLVGNSCKVDGYCLIRGLIPLISRKVEKTGKIAIGGRHALVFSSSKIGRGISTS